MSYPNYTWTDIEALQKDNAELYRVTRLLRNCLVDIATDNTNPGHTIDAAQKALDKADGAI